MKDENTTVEKVWLSPGERIHYINGVMAKLYALWSDTKVNRSGMRAAFRRWKPGEGIEPTLDMRQHIWGHVGPPPLMKKDKKSEQSQEDTPPPPQVYDEAGIIDEAAILTAMRAVAGEAEGNNPVGTALHKAGVSDMRLVRLLTAPKELRPAALHRILRFVARRNDIGIRWDYKQVETLRDFLFGNEAPAQRAANLIATDFYRSRGRKEKEEREEALTTQGS